jgi:sn-glycerol 3-phosphate transport system substrate-binding protein
MRARLRPLIAVGAVGALVATACGSSGRTQPIVGGPDPANQPPTCVVTRPATTKGRTTITVAEAFDPRSAAAATDLVAKFNASQRLVTVVLQAQANDAAVQHQLSSGGALPNIVVLDDIRTQAAADSGKILPASACIKASKTDNTVFMPSARSYYTVDGSQLAASANLTGPMLYFNRTILKAAGLDPSKPPATLDELYDDAVKIKAADPSVVPLAMTNSSWWVESWLTGAGNDLVNNDNGRTKPADGSTFDSQHSVKIHEWMQKMFDADLIDLVSDTADAHAQYIDLATRKSAMLIESSASIDAIDALTGGTLDPTVWGYPAGTVLPPPGPPLDIDVAPWPGLDEAGRGQVSGSAWYLTNASSPAQQAAAWTFLTWWNAEPQQVQWSLEGSYLPYNTKAVNDEKLQDVWQNTRRGHWLDTAYTELTDFDTVSPGPLIGPYSAVRAAISQSLTEVTNQAMDPVITVTETDQNIEEDLVEYRLAHP